MKKEKDNNFNLVGNNAELTFTGEDEDSDSYFRSILKELFSSNNIEQKTEYIDTIENFVGAKLSFLSRHGHIPLLGEFIDTFERKRVSLDRKGRKEIVMSLEKRQEEIESNRLKNVRGLLGI